MIGAVPVLLALAFAVTALLYASVGFGGGSTYSALLAISGLDYRLLPLVSLACNIVVVTGGSIRFARAGITPWKKAGVIVALGAPMSFLGGLTPIREATFLSLLGASRLGVDQIGQRANSAIQLALVDGVKSVDAVRHLNGVGAGLLTQLTRRIQAKKLANICHCPLLHRRNARPFGRPHACRILLLADQQTVYACAGA